MASLSGSVGKGGANAAADVKLVQQKLKTFAAMPDGKSFDVKVDGKNTKTLEDAIAEFQKRVVGMSRGDGLVEPGGKTWRALNGPVPAPPPAPKAADPKKLSGASWWRANQAKFPNSDKVGDLAGSFQSNVKAFLKALEAAGASVDVASTLRNKERAFLMHYSWEVSRGNVKPAKVPANSALDIVWDHGDDKASVQGAKEMADLFKLKFKPSLTSRHIEGKAIDMSISWSGTLKIADKKGKTVEIGSPTNGESNKELHKLGATYGVVKHPTDPPHWSTDGR